MITRVAIPMVILLAMLGCAKSEPAPIPPKWQAAMALEPATTAREVVERFRASLKYNDVPSALNMIDVIDYSAPAAASVRQRFEKMGLDMSRGGADIKVLEAKEQADVAAVIVHRNPQRGGAADVDAIFLIRRDVGWRISPEVYSYDSIRGLSAPQLATFRAVDTWYRHRKGEWKQMLSEQ